MEINKTARIFIPLMILSLSFFGCGIQTFPIQVTTTDISISTPNIIHTTSALPKETEVMPTIFPSPTFEATEVILTFTLSPLPNGVFFFGATPPTSQAGGMSGVAYRPYVLLDEKYVLDERCTLIYDILRFYED